MSRIHFFFFLQTEDENFMWTYVTQVDRHTYEIQITNAWQSN